MVGLLHQEHIDGSIRHPSEYLLHGLDFLFALFVTGTLQEHQIPTTVTKCLSYHANLLQSEQ
jgi:hypothetical protein